MPNSCRELLELTTNLQYQCHGVFDLNEKQLLSLLYKLDAERKPERFISLLKIFSTIYKVITNKSDYAQKNCLQQASQIISSIDVSQWVQQGLKNEELSKNLEQARLERLKQFINERSSS